MSEERVKKIRKIAKDILLLSRNTLLVNLRFIDAALSRFTLWPHEDSTLMTDGNFLVFNPEHVLKVYKLQQETIVRDYLHIVMHCVFTHTFRAFKEFNVNRTYWDLACDIAVENVITEQGLRSTQAFREKRQQAYILKLKGQLDQLTADKIYRHFVDTNLSEKEAAIIRADFYADNHEMWYMSDEEKIKKFGLPHKNKYEIAEDWQEVARRMQIEMENFAAGKAAGNMPGFLTQNLNAVTREKYDYTSFLKRFAVIGEVMKLNDDEFDYVFYSYGTQLYENMPLIEPLEYKDVKRIKDFVIAIDTSMSISPAMAQAFFQKTYNILKCEEGFFDKINVHIIQCDTEIQDHQKVTSQEEFDEYIRNVKLYGRGGTDFRPVFSLVDKLIEDKEFTNLKGLIYFTDAYGEFPARKPAYETAVVFINDELNNEDIPVWCTKLVLSMDDVENIGGNQI